MLGAIKDFILKYGKPQKIHTDNGKEFCNRLLEDFCKDNDIGLIHGRPYHPQSQGTVESYNKEIKRLLENKYLENSKKFSIYKDLPDIINIYNENVHSSTKYKHNFLFNTFDKNIIKEALKHIQKTKKKS